MRSLTMVVLLGLFACGGGKPKPKPVDEKTASMNVQPSDEPPLGKAPPAQVKSSTVRAHFVDGSNSIALEGVIKEKATNEFAIGATVVVTGPTLQGEQVQITDEKGVFAMGSLPPGKYELTVYYNDSTTKGPFEIKQGKRTKVEVELVMSSPGEIVQIIQTDAPPEVQYKTAYEALQHGALAQTIKLGEAELAKSPSSKLHAMLAIARYGVALEAARYDLLAFGGNKKTSKDITKGLTALSTELEKAQAHLVEASKDPKFSLELCVACMPKDGNMQLVPQGLFDIERDKQGKELPEGDKRRRPTYRFDHGDLAWGRAMLSYQQALASLALAYDWSWADRFLDDKQDDDRKMPLKLTIKLVDAKKVAKAREQLFAGLAASDEARLAFVAETDDDREWVPSPKQKNHASPLAVDANLYRTWEDVVLDVRSLVAGESGIAFQGLWELFDEKDPPPGFVDLGAMLTKPKNIVLEFNAIDRIEAEKNPAKKSALMVTLLKGLIGNGFRMQMKPSRLTDRLIQLRKDMSGGNDELAADKMKYFFWLN